jgi:hypothetical protein
MNLVIKIFLILLKVLNYWFLVLPARFTVLLIAVYMVASYLILGDWGMVGVRNTFDYGTTPYKLYLLFVGFPMFWAFICAWSDAKMTSAGFSGQINTALNNAIAYRNGQMSNKTAQEAFAIYKDTAHLDLMKANQGNPSFDKAMTGFNAQFGNKTAQEAFNAFTKK